MFNRAPCNIHQKNFLNEIHLSTEHNLTINYKLIDNMILNKDNNKIKVYYNTLKNLTSINDNKITY